MKHVILAIAVLFAIPSFAFAGGVELRQNKPAVAPDRLTKAQAQTLPARHKRLLDAIQKVETGGEKDPAHAIGDGGLARGWFQIHPDYYKDAATQMSESWTNYRRACEDRELSAIAVCLVWRKYGVSTDRDRALLHHYGPSALPGTETNKADKDKYWEKVQKAMR